MKEILIENKETGAVLTLVKNGEVKMHERVFTQVSDRKMLEVENMVQDSQRLLGITLLDQAVKIVKR